MANEQKLKCLHCGHAYNMPRPASDEPEERTCPKCGKQYGLFPRTEDSEEIHYEYRVVRIVHKRAIYHKACTCDDVPGIVTAPPPPKLIPKGLFTIDFWA